jgi:hypothetical protein
MTGKNTSADEYEAQRAVITDPGAEVRLTL